MPSPVPLVEAAHHGYTPRVRRPDGKAHALYPIDLRRLRTEHTGQLAMVAFGEQVQVHFSQLRTEAVGVLGDMFAAGPTDLQQIGLWVGQAREEQPRDLALLHGCQRTAAGAFQHLDAQRIGQVGTHHQTVTIRMGAENRKWVTMLGTNQRIDIGVAGQKMFTG